MQTFGESAGSSGPSMIGLDRATGAAAVCAVLTAIRDPFSGAGVAKPIGRADGWAVAYEVWFVAVLFEAGIGMADEPEGECDTDWAFI